MGHFIGFVLLLFLGSFTIGTAVMVVKELISRKKRAASDNKNAEKEDDQSNVPKP